jgi:hypothetical protein
MAESALTSTTAGASEGDAGAWRVLDEARGLRLGGLGARASGRLRDLAGADAGGAHVETTR